MQMNSGIILAGQTPDIMGNFSGGMEVRSQRNALATQEGLADLYRTQGAQILAGDQEALNALAGIDPNAALGVQQTRLGMDATRHGMQMNEANLAMRQEELAITKENARMRGMEFAAQMDAQTAAQTAAAIEKAIAMGSQAQTPEQWDAVMSQLGEDGAQFVGQFENRDMIIAGALGLSEALKMGQGPEPQSAEAKLAADFKAGLIDQTTYEAGLARLAPKGTMVETLPDGGMRYTEGVGVGGTPKFTEAQSKDNVFATRAEGSLAALEPVANALTERSGVVGEALGGVTLGLSREAMQSDDFQLARQAGLEFLATLLRKDTGAAVTPSEEDMYGRMFLPQPGDREAVLEQKKVARARAVEAIKSGMSPAQILAMGSALLATEGRTGVDQPDVSGAAAPQELSDDDLLRLYGGE